MRTFLLCICFFGLIAGLTHAKPDSRGIYLSWRVTDKFREPVPNVQVWLVAYSADGRPIGDSARWSSNRTDEKGRGQLGLVGIKPRRGYLMLEAAHPSIEAVKERVEWHQALNGRPSEKPVIELKAHEGRGVAVWRKSAADAAPALVQKLLKADETEVREIEAKLLEGESASVAPLIESSKNFSSPQRRRVAHMLWRIVNQLRVQAGKKVFEEAESVFAVEAFRNVFPEKPLTGVETLVKLGKRGEHELEWAVADLDGSLRQNGPNKPIEMRLRERFQEALNEIRKPIQISTSTNEYRARFKKEGGLMPPEVTLNVKIFNSSDALWTVESDSLKVLVSIVGKDSKPSMFLVKRLNKNSMLKPQQEFMEKFEIGRGLTSIASERMKGAWLQIRVELPIRAENGVRPESLSNQIKLMLFVPEG